jgi:hypothetical protein
MAHIFTSYIPELHVNITYYEWLLYDIKKTINNITDVFAT